MVHDVEGWYAKLAAVSSIVAVTPLSGTVVVHVIFSTSEYDPRGKNTTTYEVNILFMWYLARLSTTRPDESTYEKWLCRIVQFIGDGNGMEALFQDI